jgi:hypothetical protein
MNIIVTAKPKKKKTYIKQIDPTHYVVAVKEPAEQGKANNAIVNSLAELFDVSRSEIILVSGQTSKIKTFQVPDRLATFLIEPAQQTLI